MPKIIPLSRGKVALVDDDDYVKVNCHKWHVSSRGYVVRNHWRGEKRTLCLLHRYILNAPDGFDVDHRDGNLLNNTKANLRLATTSQNCMNRRPIKGASSRYKGVSWRKRQQKWVAYIKANGHQQYLGCFDDETEAAKAYNAKAIEIHGEFARLNEIKEV